MAGKKIAKKRVKKASPAKGVRKMKTNAVVQTSGMKKTEQER